MFLLWVTIACTACFPHCPPAGGLGVGERLGGWESWPKLDNSKWCNDLLNTKSSEEEEGGGFSFQRSHFSDWVSTRLAWERWWVASFGFSSSLFPPLNCSYSVLKSTHPDCLILPHWGRGGSGCEGTLLLAGVTPHKAMAPSFLQRCTCLAVQQLQWWKASKDEPSGLGKRRKITGEKKFITYVWNASKFNFLWLFLSQNMDRTVHLLLAFPFCCADSTEHFTSPSPSAIPALT